MENFADLMTWVGDISTGFKTMFTNLGTIWVLYVPLGLGVFGWLFGQLRSVTWNKKGKKKSP